MGERAINRPPSLSIPVEQERVSGTSAEGPSLSAKGDHLIETCLGVKDPDDPPSPTVPVLDIASGGAAVDGPGLGWGDGGHIDELIARSIAEIGIVSISGRYGLPAVAVPVDGEPVDRIVRLFSTPLPNGPNIVRGRRRDRMKLSPMGPTKKNEPLP
jgi:hypothetical protein